MKLEVLKIQNGKDTFLLLSVQLTLSIVAKAILRERLYFKQHMLGWPDFSDSDLGQQWEETTNGP